MPSLTEASVPALTATHIEDLQLASAKLTGAKRRAFQAEMTLKYCAGRARQAERVFGWGRQTVELGLHEQRTGIECLGAQELCCGQPLLEDTHPEAAALLWTLVESQSQQDPTFRTPLCYTRPARWPWSSTVTVTGCVRCSRPSPRNRRHLRQSPHQRWLHDRHGRYPQAREYGR